jgi:hypothetical protein
MLILDIAACSDGAAKECRAGIASAEPIRVWGRENLQRTIGNGGFSFEDRSAAETVAALSSLSLGLSESLIVLKACK